MSGKTIQLPVGVTRDIQTKPPTKFYEQFFI